MPEVVTTATAFPVALANPRAKKAAERSSMAVYSASPRGSSTPRARARAPERLPGHNTAWLRPWPIRAFSSSSAASRLRRANSTPGRFRMDWTSLPCNLVVLTPQQHSQPGRNPAPPGGASAGLGVAGPGAALGGAGTPLDSLGINAPGPATAGSGAGGEAARPAASPHTDRHRGGLPSPRSPNSRWLRPQGGPDQAGGGTSG